MNPTQEHTATDPALLDECVEWITRLRGVSFAELRGWLERHHIPVDGTWTWEVKPNLVVWANMSEQFADFVDDLRATKRTTLRPLGAMAGILVYSCDGQVLRLPIAQRPPRNGYKDPHWIPTIIDPHPQKVT